jgi:hypothetical protein
MMLYNNTGRSRRTVALLPEKQAQAYSRLMSVHSILCSQQLDMHLHICNVMALAHGRLQKYHYCCREPGSSKLMIEAEERDKQVVRQIWANSEDMFCTGIPILRVNWGVPTVATRLDDTPLSPYSLEPRVPE